MPDPSSEKHIERGRHRWRISARIAASEAEDLREQLGRAERLIDALMESAQKRRKKCPNCGFGP